jgi:hypothetical protein
VKFPPPNIDLEKNMVATAVVIDFSVEQVAYALVDAGFEASDKTVAEVVEYINNDGGSESLTDLYTAFSNYVAEAATYLKLPKQAE